MHVYKVQDKKEKKKREKEGKNNRELFLKNENGKLQEFLVRGSGRIINESL